MIEQKKKNLGRLESVLFIKVSLPRWFSFIFSNIGFQNSLDFNQEPRGNPKYFNGTLDILHPSIWAKASTFGTVPTGTNSDFPKFIFNL